MRTDDELLEVIKEKTDNALGDLWDALTPEERGKVFKQLLAEFVECNYL